MSGAVFCFSLYHVCPAHSRKSVGSAGLHFGALSEEYPIWNDFLTFSTGFSTDFVKKKRGFPQCFPKITFPGSGIAAIATSHNNLDDIKKQLKIQTIGHDKVNQLRHVRFFKDIHGMVEHMRKHANILRPKFEAVENILDRELGGLEIGTWTKPHGGYFISFDSLNGCAKEIVAKCKKAGVVMTGAGATYPYGKDPEDRNIRIAPSYPPLQDLITATELFALCVKLVSVNKLLEEM